MPHPIALFPWRTFTLVGTTCLLISCGGSPPTAETAPAEISEPAATTTARTNAEVAPAEVAPAAPEPTTAPVQAAPPATATPPATAVAIELGESRLLTPAELGWVERNLPVAERQINSEQSFWVNLRDIGEVAFVLTEAVSDPSIAVNDLAIYLMLPDGTLLEQLPANLDSNSWMLWETQAVSFWMYQGYEVVVVMADYITGVGPNGSEPFPVTTIYNNAGGYFLMDEVASRMLTDWGTSTVGEALDMLQTEDLGYLP